MPQPIFRLSLIGSEPVKTTREALEAEMQRVINLMYPMTLDGPADVLDEVNAARAAAAASAAAAALYDGPEVDEFAELATATPTDLPVGGLIRVKRTGVVYERVSTGGDYNYTGTGGVRLSPIPLTQTFLVNPAETTALNALRIEDGGQGSERVGLHDLGVNDSPAIGAFATTTTPINMTTGYVPVALDTLGLGTDGWLTRALRGVGSTIRGRAGLAFGYLATITGGHDNGVTSTGGQAMGAANFVGNPWDPRNLLYAFWGYLSAVLFGRDNLVLSAKSGAGGERCIVAGASSNAAFGYKGRTGNLPTIDGLTGYPVFDNLYTGQVSLGFEAWALKDGAIAAGKFIVINDGAGIGRGINTGTPLVGTDEVGMGDNTRKFTIISGKGDGTAAGVGSLKLRVAPANTVAANGINMLTEGDGFAASLKLFMTNTGSGGYYRMQLDVLAAGAAARGFDIDASNGAMSFLPAMANTHRLGSAALPFAFGWIQTAWTVTSDARTKQDIEPISAAELRAWAAIKTQKYRIIDGGAEARGYIAQHIIAAYAGEGLDAVEAGLVVVGDNGMYGVNYSACEAVRMQAIEARLAAAGL